MHRACKLRDTLPSYPRCPRSCLSLPCSFVPFHDFSRYPFHVELFEGWLITRGEGILDIWIILAILRYRRDFWNWDPWNFYWSTDSEGWDSKLRKKEKDFKSSKNSRISIVLFRETIDNIGEKNFEQNVKSTWIRRMDREIGWNKLKRLARVRDSRYLCSPRSMQVSRERDEDRWQGKRRRRKMREACVYHRSFALVNVKTVLRFAVAWR